MSIEGMNENLIETYQGCLANLDESLKALL
jgi:hypothetical protein